MEKIITKQLFRVFTLLALMLTTAQAANATFYVKGSFDNWGAGVAMTDQGNDIFTAEITTTGAIDFKLINIYDNNGHHEDWWGYSGNYGTATSLPWTFYDLVERGGGDMHINVAGTLRFTLNTHYHWVEVVATTLVWIEGNGTVNNSYTVSDDLQVVYVNSDKNFAVARDLTGTIVTPNGIDYMTTVAKEHSGPWQQFNWVMLDFTGTNLLTRLSDYTTTNKTNNNIALIQGLKGVYTDNNNYTIKVTDLTTVTEGNPSTPNVYCPANFGPNTDGVQKGYPVENGMSVGESANVDYWFLTPKPMEVFELSGALWCGDGFYMEKREYVPATATKPAKWINPAGLKGGIGLNLSCNSINTPNLQQGQSYRFLTVAWKKVSKSEPSISAPLRDGLDPEPYQTLNATIQAGALNLTGGNDQIVTGVSEVKTSGDVVSVTYCDLAGRMSQKPFAGVNIIVTRYSDGSVKTTKAIK